MNNAAEEDTQNDLLQEAEDALADDALTAWDAGYWVLLYISRSKTFPDGYIKDLARRIVE